MTNSVPQRISALSTEQRAALAGSLRARLAARPSGPGQYDVAVLGGGIAGLTLALQLRRARPGIRVLVVERAAHPVPEATHKVGESTVEIAAHYLRDILGLGDHLEAEQIRKFGLRMFFSNHDNTDITRRVELGSSVFPPLRTYQLDRGRLENEVGAALLRGRCGVPPRSQGRRRRPGPGRAAPPGPPVGAGRRARGAGPVGGRRHRAAASCCGADRAPSARGSGTTRTPPGSASRTPSTSAPGPRARPTRTGTPASTGTGLCRRTT